MTLLKYAPPPTIALFHRSSAIVRGIRGPVGSAKSTGAIMEMYIRAQNMVPCRDGVKRCRFLVVRNTYSELKSTTIKTFEAWFGPENGYPAVVYDTPIRWSYTWKTPDQPDVYLEVLFLALDRPKDIGKLKSLEVTGILLSEAAELERAIFDMATSRHGRYPHAMDKPDGYSDEWPSWHGIIMETNSMDDDHWWYHYAEIEKPEGYEFFAQPGGFDPYAENLDNLPGGRNYYTAMAAGKRDAFVKVFIDNKYGSTADGRPVYPEFNEKIHVSAKPLTVYRGLPLYLGWDYGLTPACVALQVSARGQVRVLREWLTWGGTMGIRQFTETVVKPALALEFPGMKIRSWGDPGGSQRSQNDEVTAMDIQKDLQLPTEPAPTNAFAARRDAVVKRLTLLVDGDPGFILDPSCIKLRKGMSGSYKYRRIQVAGSERFSDEPDKNEYSHVAESLQYPLVAMDAGLRAGRTQLPARSAPAPVDRLMGI